MLSMCAIYSSQASILMHTVRCNLLLHFNVVLNLPDSWIAFTQHGKCYVSDSAAGLFKMLRLWAMYGFITSPGPPQTLIPYAQNHTKPKTVCFMFTEILAVCPSTQRKLPPHSIWFFCQGVELLRWYLLSTTRMCCSRAIKLWSQILSDSAHALK
jgi:hypothetical protein